jgi:hypothetical protein
MIYGRNNWVLCLHVKWFQSQQPFISGGYIHCNTELIEVILKIPKSFWRWRTELGFSGFLFTSSTVRYYKEHSVSGSGSISVLRWDPVSETSCSYNTGRETKSKIPVILRKPVAFVLQRPVHIIVSINAFCRLCPIIYLPAYLLIHDVMESELCTKELVHKRHHHFATR